MSKLSLFLIAVLSASGCWGQSDLRQRLGLSDSQAVAIAKLNQDYNTYWFARQQLVDSVNQELAMIAAVPVPDAREIGTRAVELEVIRRDRVEKQNILRGQVAAQLTAAQITSVNGLMAAFTLQPLVSDAACAYLVNGNPYSSRWFDTTATAFPSSLGIPGLLLSGPPLPYIPPAPTASFCNSDLFPISVRDYLTLTEAQIASIYAASAAYNDFYARRQNRLMELRLEIQDLTSRGNTDPIPLGLRYAEMAQIGRDLDVKSAQLRDAARTVLTAAQTVKLKALQDAQAVLESNAVNYAVGCNLLQLPPGSGLNQQASGGLSFCPL